MRKKIMVILVVLLALGLTVACSSDSDGDKTKETNADVNVNEEGFPIVDEKIELSLMAPLAGETTWDEREILQEYEDMTNIEFEYNTSPENDFGTTLNLDFASGDLDDIIFAAGNSNFTADMEVKYGEQGLIIPLEDLIEEYAPNIQKMFEERPDVKKSITTLDGHIYALPRVVKEGGTSSWYMSPFWYNGRWLDELGVDELPETTEELYDLLVRFRDEDPNGNGEADEIPLSAQEFSWLRTFFLGAFGIKYWGIEEFDGEVRYSPLTENYKAFLEYMHKLYDEDLLDNEIFSQSSDQISAKTEDNRVGLFQSYFSFQATGETEEEAMNNPMFQPLTSSITDEPLLPLNPGINRGSFAITKENPYPEASIRWVDYFYSQEGSSFLNSGPEGLLWEWDENEEYREHLDVPDEYDSWEEWRGAVSPDYGILPPVYSQETEGAKKTEFDEFIESETEEKYVPYAEIPYPEVYLTSDEQKEINTIQVDLQDYVEQMEAKFITGVEPLSNWDEFVQTIESMNIDRYIEVYQDAYDRWVEAE